MKPHNAPERKRERQLGALDRLKANMNRGFHINGMRMIKINPKLTQKEIKVLEERTTYNLRHIRTKKTRSV